MTDLEVDLFLALHFDAEFAARSAEDFIQDILIDSLAARHVITGYDFVFGKGRKGDAGLLRRAAGEFGFGFTQVPALRQDDGTGDIYSSTTIRDHLRAGRPRAAAWQLGHWWEIDARVQHGDKRGRQIGFPTANLALDEYIRPAFGVYAVRVAILAAEGEEHDGGGQMLEWLQGVANLGRRPTIRDGELELLEVHLLDFDGDLYGAQLRVSLVEFIRPEQKFDGLEALTAQIGQDRDKAREILANSEYSLAWPKGA
jgi:riboflavin kinase/FMN adenylyltransferase